MAFVTLLAASYPIAALSASTSQPSPGTGSAVSGPHLSRGVPKDAFAGVLDSSTKPVESDSSSIITPIGSSRLANGSYTPPNTNTNGSIFDIPFEYPGLDGIEASDADIQCKESFGANLSRTSCNNALMNLGSRSDSLTWGQRGHGNFQLKLPFRASSCEFPLEICPESQRCKGCKSCRSVDTDSRQHSRRFLCHRCGTCQGRYFRYCQSCRYQASCDAAH